MLAQIEAEALQGRKASRNEVPRWVRAPEKGKKRDAMEMGRGSATKDAVLGGGEGLGSFPGEDGGKEGEAEEDPPLLTPTDGDNSAASGPASKVQKIEDTLADVWF